MTNTVGAQGKRHDSQHSVSIKGVFKVAFTNQHPGPPGDLASWCWRQPLLRVPLGQFKVKGGPHPLFRLKTDRAPQSLHNHLGDIQTQSRTPFLA